MEPVHRSGSAAISALLLYSLCFCVALAGAKAVPALYVFGDSLVDAGNNNHLPLSILRADYLYNGIDYTGRRPTGRFSNGKNAADFIAEKLKLSPAPPFLSRRNDTFAAGASFASGGAGILNDTNEGIAGQDLPLGKQLWYFAKVRSRRIAELGSESAALDHFSDSIFLFVIGSNDVLNFRGSNRSANSSADQYVAVMAAGFKTILKAAYGLGARKFLVIGLPPVGCAPKQRSGIAGGECNVRANSLCEKYNAELTRLLSELKSELPDFHYSYFDAYGVLLSFIQKSANYGFVEARSACCGLGKLRSDIPCSPVSLLCSNRSNHVFWDIYHPTERAARSVVDELFSNASSYVVPITVQQLIDS